MPGDDFDAVALYDVMDRVPRERKLSWTATAAAIWEQSSVLNATRDDHPISPSTRTGIPRRPTPPASTHCSSSGGWTGRRSASHRGAPTDRTAPFPEAVPTSVSGGASAPCTPRSTEIDVGVG